MLQNANKVLLLLLLTDRMCKLACNSCYFGAQYSCSSLYISFSQHFMACSMFDIPEIIMKIAENSVVVEWFPFVLKLLTVEWIEPLELVSPSFFILCSDSTPRYILFWLRIRNGLLWEFTYDVVDVKVICWRVFALALFEDRPILCVFFTSIGFCIFNVLPNIGLLDTLSNFVSNLRDCTYEAFIITDGRIYIVFTFKLFR